MDKKIKMIRGEEGLNDEAKNVMVKIKGRKRKRLMKKGRKMNSDNYDKTWRERGYLRVI